MTATPVLPLAGFTVAVTAARRRDELAALLERRGARVIVAPAIRLVPLDDDAELRAATDACVDAPLDLAVATTGIGFRGWLEAADGWGLGDDLRKRFADSRLLARGPKARGAIRTAGLREEWSPPSESMSEVLEYLLARDLTGLRIAVQLHGEPLPDFVDALVAAGADVVPVPVYRWALPADLAPLDRLVEQVVSRAVDAVTFTSAPAVLGLLHAADERMPSVLNALREDVVAACVGPVTAAPLQRRGVAVVQPDRSRLGNLVRTVVDEVPARRGKSVIVHGHRLDVRGHAVVIDDHLVALPPTHLAVLRALVDQPGRVLGRAELLAALPGATDAHAVEVTVARLRQALGDPAIVQTIVKRGYRIAYDP